MCFAVNHACQEKERNLKQAEFKPFIKRVPVQGARSKPLSEFIYPRKLTVF